MQISILSITELLIIQSIRLLEYRLLEYQLIFSEIVVRSTQPRKRLTIIAIASALQRIDLNEVVR